MAEIRVCISRSKIKYIEKINDEIKELLEEKNVEEFDILVSFSISNELCSHEECVVFSSMKFREFHEIKDIIKNYAEKE